MEFLYVHRGQGTLIMNQQTYGIFPGTLIVFQPFQLHSVQMTDMENSPFIRSPLIFDPAVVEEHLRI
jgi:quercetin dioxygenase-like cupin family protein